ncbi:spermatogenesis-associated serine-rich protein 2 isoform X2 [Ornithorhynchus anatinus]|nr:spermatogenesis-associated serine-rich protein 2 isoform X2 [Ornithorhynchus anatinus]
MKEKISAVRAIVPNRSNNEIILVLQHFDNCVDKTVQAFMEGSASEVLKEWTVTGKKKNKKKKSKPKPAPEPSKPAPTPEEQPGVPSERGGLNGYHVNGSANDTESVDSFGEGLDVPSTGIRDSEDTEPAAAGGSDGSGSRLANGISDFDPKCLALPQGQASHRALRPESRNAGRPLSRAAPASQLSALGPFALLEDAPLSSANKKLGSNIEKSVKDLQRCTVSLARYRVVVKEEMDASIKKMKQAFADLQCCLMDREVALLAEMDKVKAEAMEILLSRQKKAETLKKMTDVAVRMSEDQLVELRADIKHFVSERKYDEDLGRVARFTCDVDALKKSIDSFGQVSHPKNSYSTRSRCNSSNSVSLSGPSLASAPFSSSACASAPSLTIAAGKKAAAPGESPAAGAHTGSRPAQPHREVSQGNRRGGGGQGSRPQGPKPGGPPGQGRPDSGSRHRNGPGAHPGSRPHAAPPQPPGGAGEQSPARPRGTNGTGAGPPGHPSAQGRSGPGPAGARGLPQRKPRAGQPETVRS